MMPGGWGVDKWDFIEQESEARTMRQEIDRTQREETFLDSCRAGVDCVPVYDMEDALQTFRVVAHYIATHPYKYGTPLPEHLAEARKLQRILYELLRDDVK